MRPFNKKKLIFIPFAAAAFLALVGFVVMSLWNYLLPGLLHVGVITFWQALGLFILCKILFGFGKGGHGMRGGGNSWWRGRMEERFKNMSPEDMEKFRQKMKNRCGGDRRGWGNTNWDDFKTETEKTAE